MGRGRDINDPMERTPPEPARSAPTEPLSRERQTVQERGYPYRVSPAEWATLRDVGAFRTIDTEDLSRLRYAGRGSEMREDLRALESQGLLRHHTVWTNKGQKLEVVVLTKTGKSLVGHEGGLAPGQRIYAGLVKRAEIAHDAAIYRMYHAERRQIEAAGGRVKRVVLDFEFKKKLYAPLVKAKALPALAYARKQAAVAKENDLKVVDGKILLPDLRIEYDAADGTRTHVDLELATEHYRGGQVRGKAQAGFKMYAAPESAGRLASAFDPRFAAEIFDL
jgi:hypothetical protein